VSYLYDSLIIVYRWPEIVLIVE